MARKRILIIDDEKFFVEPVKLYLEKNGFEVIAAHDGMSGWKRAHSENPDLMIVDLMLPGMDGYQICRLLKFDDKYRNTPIIIVSAKDSEKDRELGRRCGADLYITKPIDYAALTDKIKQLTTA